jgi:hypothetical protein
MLVDRQLSDSEIRFERNECKPRITERLRQIIDIEISYAPLHSLKRLLALPLVDTRGIPSSTSDYDSDCPGCCVSALPLPPRLASPLGEDPIPGMYGGGFPIG